MNPSISNDRVRDVVKTVNGIAPDINGDINTITHVYVQTVNNNPPDVNGNVNVGWDVTGVSSNNTILVSPTGNPWEFDFQARVSGSFSNGLSAVSDWLYTSKSASDIELASYGMYPTATNVNSALQAISDTAVWSVSDTESINISKSGWNISADVIISPAAWNLISIQPTGLYASNNSIDVRADWLAWYGLPSNTMDVRTALLYLAQNRIPSQPENGAGIPTFPILTDVSINWRTWALVNEYMQRYTNPYWVSWYDAEYGIVANVNLGSGIAQTFSAFGDDSQRFTLWVNAAGKLMVKTWALPTSDSDWVVVGTQS